jgi:hypothetical protein
VSYAAAELSGSDSSKFTGKSHSENEDLRKDFSLSSKDYLSQCTPAIKTTIARSFPYFAARQACPLAMIRLISASGQPAISLAQYILEYGLP